MSTFVRNPRITESLADRAFERARDAADVLVGQVQDTLRDGSEDNRSDPGQPPRSQSGELENSVRILDESQEPTGVHIRVGTELIKGWWLEFGTASMAPRPWLRPSLLAARPAMLEQFKTIAEA